MSAFHSVGGVHTAAYKRALDIVAAYECGSYIRTVVRINVCGKIYAVFLQRLISLLVSS